jgi:hypothetical protein
VQRISWFIFIAFLGNSCIQPKNPHASLAPGIWRGVLQLNPEPKLSLKDEIDRYEKDGQWPIHVLEDELPFLFEVVYKNDRPVVELINGEERITLDEVSIGKNKTTAEDTFFINIPVFDSHLRGILKAGILQGEWVVRSRANYTVPFAAHFGQKDRFLVLPETPITNLSGTWACSFGIDQKKQYLAIGEFRQNDSHLTGTFRTETGDHRYLEGLISGNKFYLSAFDGSHAFLYVGKVTGDSLLGVYKSGKHYSELWMGVRNDTIDLPNAGSLSKATGNKVDFRFLDSDQKIKTISDYSADLKILQITGTWCPNCWDETKFLTNYLREHPDKKIDVIALACERYKDTARAIQAIKTYKEKMNLPYDILLASNSTNKLETSKALPFIDSVIAYPTMVFLNKKNEIQFVHTGFDGPATSKHQAYKAQFDQKVNSILNSSK